MLTITVLLWTQSNALNRQREGWKLEKRLAGVRHLVSSKFGLDLLHDAVALDAGKLAGSMQDVPI